MKLDAWMEQDHSLDENLGLIESLSQAVNEVHDRGEALGGLQPDRIEVEADGVDLSETRGGRPSPAYAPPDGEGDSAADVYAVGRIAWEVLAGRAAGESPRHLSEVRPDISKELADAIMACLEESADWRPKDLTFLAQMAGVRQKSAARAPQRARGSSRSARGRAPARPRRSQRQGGRTWPLLAALVVVLGLAFFAWRQFAPAGFPGASTSSAPQTPPPAAPSPATPPAAEPATPTEEPPPAAEIPTTPPETPPAAGQADAPVQADAAPQSPPPQAPPRQAPEPVSPPETRPQARPAPPSNPPPAVVSPPVQSAPVRPPATTRPAPETSRPAPPPAPVPVPQPAPETSRPASPPAAPEPEEASPAPAAPPAAPAVLTAVSPLQVKRPGKVLLDLRGSGFQDQHRVRVLPVKKAPRGISVVRHKRANESLITVLIELTDEAEPGEYAIAVEDGVGTRSDALIFTVTK